jgi:hypothetical protein
MKQCLRCNISKRLLEFNKNKSRKDGLQKYCKLCTRKSDKLLYQNNPNRKIELLEYNKQLKIKSREIVKKYKDFGCKICGEKEHVCLDFHHLESSEKEYQISAMMGMSVKKLQLEILKCVVLCSNCHRKVHANLIDL